MRHYGDRDLLALIDRAGRHFERIHRSNLVGMGVLPLEFSAGQTWQSLGLTGDEIVTSVERRRFLR